MQNHRAHAPRTPASALLFVLLALLLMAAALVLNKDVLLRQMLQMLLREYDITLHEARGLQWNTHRAQLSFLHLLLPGATTPTRIENLQVNYRLRELLQGRVRSIHVETMDVYPGQSPQSSALPSAEAVMATLAMLQAMPDFTADITALRIVPWGMEGSLDARTDQREFHALWRASDWQLDWRSNWHDAAFVSSLFIPETSIAQHNTPGAHTASVQLQRAGQQILRADLTAHAAGGGLLLDGSAQVSLLQVSDVPQTSGLLDALTAGVAGNLDLRGQITLPRDRVMPARMALSLQPMRGTWTWQAGTLDWTLDALSLEGECRPEGICRFSHTVAGGLATQSGQPLSTLWPVLELPGGVLPTALSLQTSGTAEWAAGLWQIDAPHVDLHLPQLHVNDRRLSARATLSALRVTGQSTPLRLTQLETAMRLDDVQGLTLPYALPMPTLSASLSWNGAQLKSNGSLQLAERLALRGELEFDIATGLGRALVQLPATQFDAGSARLSALLQTSELPGDILAGSVSAQTQLDLARRATGSLQVSGPLEIQLNGLSGFVGDTAVTGLSSRFEGQLDGGALRSRDVTLLAMDSLDPGIALRNLQASIAVDTAAGRLQLAGLTLDVFGGRVSSDGGDFALDPPSGMLELQLERIDIESILALGAYEGVQANGLLSGTLPVSVDANRITVEAGTLHAESPGGSIRYASEADSGNAAVDFVNTTLSNYRYDMLDASVNYRPDGELALSVQMQGVNPDNNPQQRINLNLNISDNIPSLLRSLQAGRSVTDAVEAHLRSR
jgi:hypothetical protein